jgi:Cu2+-exporting ATPase
MNSSGQSHHSHPRLQNDPRDGGDGHHDHHAHMMEEFRRRFWISVILSLPVMILAPVVQGLLGVALGFPGDRYVQFAFSSIVFFYGGWPFLRGLGDELRKRSPGMMTLIALAVGVAYGYSSAVVFGLRGGVFFWELVTLVDVMLLGHWIEMRSVAGASNALQELATLMPLTARRLREHGESEDVAISELRVADRVLVRPGEKIPADGEVLQGKSRVNESLLTGESTPVGKKPGDEVIGGSLNGNGSLTIAVTHTGEASYLSRVIAMVRKAQQAKSRTQSLADAAAGWLFYVSLGAGIITLTVWLSAGHDFDYALERMVTVMVISCPHALGLAVPLVVAISTAVSAQNGLLIRNRTAFERAGKLSAIVFDKTGTLTRGEFGVTRVGATVGRYSDEEILKAAASLERHSEHPIAAGIVRKAGDLHLATEEATGFTSLPGRGVTATVGGRRTSIVSAGYLREQAIPIPDRAFGSETETVVFVLVDESVIGFIALADEIRDESFGAVRTLKEQGIRVLMATGDTESVAKNVSAALSLDGFYAGVLPEDKLQIVRALQEEGEFVAMTGDGINDAPALAQANIGIAVGSGTDVAAETADVVLVNSNPRGIVRLILFGAATHRKMVQNLLWAVGYNVIAIPLAAGVLAPAGIILSPAVGAVLMSLSTVIVAINAQLLRRSLLI